MVSIFDSEIARILEIAIIISWLNPFLGDQRSRNPYGLGQPVSACSLDVERVRLSSLLYNVHPCGVWLMT